MNVKLAVATAVLLACCDVGSRNSKRFEKLFGSCITATAFVNLIKKLFSNSLKTGLYSS